MVRWVNNGTGKLLPFVGMLVAMLTQSGSMVVIKFATNDGINKYVMVVYSMALSSFLLLPFAFFHHRFCFSYISSFFQISTQIFLYDSYPTLLIFLYPFELSRSERPPLTFSAICSFLLLALFVLVLLSNVLYFPSNQVVMLNVMFVSITCFQFLSYFAYYIHSCGS